MRVRFLSRVGVLLGMAVLSFHTAQAEPRDLTSGGAAPSTRPDRTSKPADGRDDGLAKARTNPATAPDIDLTLSPAALLVSQIAHQNGDHRFILVDKSRGRIFVFQNGKVTFSRPALTGESMADQFPSDAIAKPFSQHVGVKYKVTPAGRFTLTHGHDEALGETFDINELQGSDWMIAIHQVWLGIRSQHRDARLLSASDQDKHITEGCIDVDPNTITQLLRLLPNANGTAIYILPNDERLIKGLFQPRSSATTEAAHAG
jgi:hypothetical protein